MQFLKSVAALGLFSAISFAAIAQPPDFGQAQEAVALGADQMAVSINVTDACKGGPASKAGMPTWSEVEAGNVAYYRPFTQPNGTPQSYSSPRGVPDLDNPMDNLSVDDSLQNVISLLTNVTKGLENPGQFAANAIAGDDAVGSGICRHTPTSKGRLLREVSYCDYLAACAEPMANPPSNAPNATWEKFMWVPDDMDFMHNLDDLTPGVNLQTAGNDTEFNLPVNLNQADAQKWSLTFIKVLDKWNNPDQGGVGQAIDALNIVKSKVEKFRSWWSNFSGMVNRYGEGYHLGAYDEMRPDLHICVGYYGHRTSADYPSLLDGKVSLGANYNSLNISREARAQVRTGGMLLKAFGKNLDLLPTPEANIQYDGLRSWNCDAPFGMNLNLCPATIQTPFDSVCDASQYLSMDNLGEGSDNFEFGVFQDFYPVNLGNGVVWPRQNPMTLTNMSTSSLWSEDDIMVDELPSTAVMSAGLNLGYDFGLKDPTPRVLKSQPVGPVMLVIKWDVDYGLKWVHDSNLLMEDVTSALTETGSAIDVTDILTREMHAMQADDLTADNGQELYVSPSVFAGLGYAIQKKKFGLVLTIDAGLHVDLEPSFYGGLADMNVAMKDAMLQVNANDGLACEPVYAEEMTTVATSCSADNYMAENDYLQAAYDAINANKPLPSKSIYYYCGKEKPEIEGRGSLRSCASFGMCLGPDGDRKHNLTSAECARMGKEHEFIAYECREHQKTEIVGWNGPGCSPLLDGSGFPTAPGGMCRKTGGVIDVSIGDAVLADVDRFERVRPGRPVGEAAQAQRSTQKSLTLGSACDSGFSCVEGACLQSCTSSSQCGDGFTCDTGTKTCVHPGGLPFVEQIAWRVDNPPPGEPQHSVWTHAANKLEAKVDFSLGFDLKAWLKLFGKKFDIIDENRARYWNLANAGKFQYEIGLSADYDDSCSPDVGKVTRYQSGGSPALTPRASWVNSGSTSSEELINTCLASGANGLPDNVADESDMPTQPTEDAIAGDVTEMFEWTEDFAIDMWDEYHGNMCINGVPWTQWYAQAEETGQPNIPVTASGTVVGNLQTASGINTMEQAILAQSGCLALNRPFAGPLIPQMGVQGGQMDIFNRLIDPDGEVIPSNVVPQVRNQSFFTPWYSGVQACLTNYMDSGAVSLQMDIGPCKGEEGTPIDTDNPNGRPQDTGVIIDRDVREDRAIKRELLRRPVEKRAVIKPSEQPRAVQRARPIEKR